MSYWSAEPMECGCGDCKGLLLKGAAGEIFPQIFRNERQAGIAANLLNTGALTASDLEVLFTGTTSQEAIGHLRDFWAGVTM